MTKESFEAREKLKLMNIAKEWLRTKHSEGNVQSLVKLILSFTEPREKRIADLEDKLANADYQLEGRDNEIRELEKQLKAEHTRGEIDFVNMHCNSSCKKVKELEAQIEKMKCCFNCKHFNKENDIEYCWNCERQLVNSLDNLSREEIIKDEWEIKEK